MSLLRDAAARRRARAALIAALPKLSRLPPADAPAPRGVCPLCQQSKRLVRDHCHTSGQSRALICCTCNTGLGMFKDSPESLERAAAYLRTHTAASTPDWALRDIRSHHPKP